MISFCCPTISSKDTLKILAGVVSQEPSCFYHPALPSNFPKRAGNPAALPPQVTKGGSNKEGAIPKPPDPCGCPTFPKMGRTLLFRLSSILASLHIPSCYLFPFSSSGSGWRKRMLASRRIEMGVLSTISLLKQSTTHD